MEIASGGSHKQVGDASVPLAENCEVDVVVLENNSIVNLSSTGMVGVNFNPRQPSVGIIETHLVSTSKAITKKTKKISLIKMQEELFIKTSTVDATKAQKGVVRSSEVLELVEFDGLGPKDGLTSHSGNDAMILSNYSISGAQFSNRRQKRLARVNNVNNDQSEETQKKRKGNWEDYVDNLVLESILKSGKKLKSNFDESYCVMRDGIDDFALEQAFVPTYLGSAAVKRQAKPTGRNKTIKLERSGIGESSS